jgi:peptidoglycan hydrolase-like protein with peptidoglycan-binding domain
MPTVQTENRISRGLVVAGCGVAAIVAAGAGAASAATASAASAPVNKSAVSLRGSRLASAPPFAQPAKSAPVPWPAVLVSGDRGAAVRQLQRALHIGTTGSFGAGTRRAVVRFQRTHGLIADGMVGAQTRRALHLNVRIVPTPGTTGGAPAGSSGTGGYTIPASIVMCESGGNYGAVNPSSGAGGAYQILPSTWAAYGGTGLPQDASPAEQNAIAAKIYASGGASQWSC